MEGSSPLKPTKSSLAEAHPDHPKLSDLGITEANSAAMTSSAGGGIGFTATPQSFAVDDPASPEAPMKRPGGLTDGPNARSKSVTVADGDNTYGVLNRHPAGPPNPKKSPLSSSSSTVDGTQQQSLKGSFRVGVSEDRNKRCRRTMEDAHSFVYDFAAIRGQGYFAVFDGHAGKHAAEWCGQNFHEYFLDALLASPDQTVPDLLNKTFHVVDSRLSLLAQAGKTQSGCTAVTAFLRVEKPLDNEPRGFTNENLTRRGLIDGKGEEALEAQTSVDSGANSRRGSLAGGTGSIGGTAASNSGSSMGRRGSAKKIGSFLKGLTGGNKDDHHAEDEAAEPEPHVEAIDAQGEGLRRVLYTANVGDARAVLCRGGKAVRLTYDHKGSDSQEAKRITDAGGFVMNNRVNGVLAVTRSLGDASMKEFVVGSPYTTETALDEQDEFLIVACDGLWDVTEDQEAVDLIRSVQDPQDASKKLLEHAITNYSTDNLSVMVIRFYH